MHKRSLFPQTIMQSGASSILMARRG
uniref:Uncharacterized protein n=1 Tax=Anguilla anguilla TaxID=7936 RepID=A0A0E9TU23_ANGAN